GLRHRRAEAPVRTDPGRRRLPALPQLRHRRADGDERRGRRPALVCAHRRRGARAASRRSDRRAADETALRRGRRRPDGEPRWREYRPPVDLYVAPVIGVDLPPVDVEELDVRIPLTAFLRPFNILGWAALAIGDLQLVAPRDEVVLAAGLAWERHVGSGHVPE